MPAATDALFKAAEAGALDDFQAAAAALDGHVRQLKADNGADCLHIAAHAGRTELCKYLVDTLHFDINSQDGERGAAVVPSHHMWHACRRRRRRQRRAAVALPSHAHCLCLPPSTPRIICNAGSGATPLALAISGNHVETAEALLVYSPDVNRRGSGEGAAAPLHLAVGGGHQALAAALLAAGADANAPSGSGTPLMLAAARSNAPLIEALLAAGADVHATSGKQGLTPLFMAAALGDSAQCVRLLAGAGADVNGRAYGSFTPLHVAAEGGKLEMAEALLEVGLWVAVLA